MHTPLIQDYHFAYREATGLDVTLNFYRESMWREWLRYGSQNCGGFTIDDLRSVIGIRKRRAKEKAHGAHSVSFNALIGSPDLCEEDISEARAKQRERKPTSRDKVLAQSGRPDVESAPAKQVGDVMAEAKALENFRAWKEVNL